MIFHWRAMKEAVWAETSRSPSSVGSTAQCSWKSSVRNSASIFPSSVSSRVSSPTWSTSEMTTAPAGGAAILSKDHPPGSIAAS